MTERERPSEIARAWTAEMVAAILRPLRPKTEEALYAIPWIARFPDPDLAAAALMISLAARYAGGESPDALMAGLTEAAEEPERPLPAESARSLALIARLMVSSATLPDPRWCEPLYHAQHLAIACAREAAAAGGDPAEVLRRLLVTPVEEEGILDAAGNPPGFQIEADLELAEALEGLGEEALEATRSALPETTEDRPDLVLASATMARLQSAAEGARGDEAAAARLEIEAERFAGSCAGISYLELELMRQLDEDERLLIEVAAIAKPVITVSAEMEPTDLTDLIDGERRIPRSMELYLGLAGQSFQQRIGPIVSWSVAFERLLPDGFAEGAPARVGIGLSDDVDTEFTVRVTYDGEDMDASLYYPPRSATATLALAVLALTWSVRLDFYLLSGNRSIRHVSQGGIVFPEDDLRERIRARAVTRCRELMVDGRQAVIEALSREHSGAEAPAIAFSMNEQGKSEQLLDARSPGAVLGPGREATPAREAELAAARRRLLIAEARRIEGVGEAGEAQIAEAASAYIGLIQRSRGRDPRERARRAIADAEALVPAVASADRAVVHLTIDYRGLELAWADRAEGPAQVELLDCSEVDLDRLAQALADPEGGSVAALDEPDGPGLALGRRLREQMLARGVGQLLVCSTRDLHQLPVHALPLDPEGRERLLDVADVIYCPSGAIASSLAELPPSEGPKLVVAAEGLSFGPTEAALVARLTGAEEVLTGEASTPAAVLAGLRRASWIHIASHGGYLPNDYLASGLHLPTPAEPEGHLNVARILAEAGLEGIDLAVLGACQTGAGQTAPATLDVAGGIDTAFLAAGVRNVVSALWSINDLGALLFHGELYRNLGAGRRLIESYQAAIDLLRSGSWQHVAELPLGDLLAEIDPGIGATLLAAKGSGLDFAELRHWAPYRLCGLGAIAAEDPRQGG
ncbi:MAG TPA: CHAT domain-containing protein [Solirubrobacterales bacterium]